MDLIEIAKKDDYRRSVFAGINPRSETEVKRGSAHRRAARVGVSEVAGAVVGGSLAGNVAGLALTRGKKKITAQTIQQHRKVRNIGTGVGAATGTVVGSNENIRSGDTRATNKKTGQRAKSTGYVPFVGRVWRYGGKELKGKKKE